MFGVSTTFVARVTHIVSTWLQDVNDHVYAFTDHDHTVFEVTNITALKAVDKTKVVAVNVLGYYAAGDEGGGIYWYDSTDTTTADNGGTVIVATDGGRWKLQHNGVVSIRQFGAKIDNSTNDFTAINNCRAAAILANFKVWCPQGVSKFGTTLVFPNSMPEGFCWDSHPDFTLQFTAASAEAINIDACYHAKIRFGRVIGNDNTIRAIRISPSAIGANGQAVCVTSEFSANFIGGCKYGIYFDCSNGDIAQCNVDVVEITNGFGLTAGVLTGNVAALLVEGLDPKGFQGNVIRVNYCQPGFPSIAGGGTWAALIDGSVNLTSAHNNINTFQFGAIDGAGGSLAVGGVTSYGINTFAGYNNYIGPIVDTDHCIQCEVGSVGNSFITAQLSTNGAVGATTVTDLTGGAYLTYIILGQNGYSKAATWRRQPDLWLENWGETAAQTVTKGTTATFTITFTVAFANTPTKVTAVASSPTVSLMHTCDIVSVTTTQLVVDVTNVSAAADGDIKVMWSAGGF